MKTSYHFLRKFKRFSVLPPKKIKKGIKKITLVAYVSRETYMINIGSHLRLPRLRS